MVGMGQMDALWRVKSNSGLILRLTRNKDNISGQSMESAPSSQNNPSALSDFELTDFKNEIINFQFDCLEVQEKLEVLMIRIQIMQRGQAGLH